MNKKKLSLDDDLIKVESSNDALVSGRNYKDERYARINISFEREFLNKFKIWCVSNNMKYNQAIKIALKDYMERY